MNRDSIDKDSGKRKKMVPYEYPMLVFALLCAAVIAIILAPAYLIPKFRPTIRAFFAPIKRFFPGGSEENAEETGKSASSEDSDLPKAFRE